MCYLFFITSVTHHAVVMLNYVTLHVVLHYHIFMQIRTYTYNPHKSIPAQSCVFSKQKFVQPAPSYTPQFSCLMHITLPAYVSLVKH